MQFDQLGAVFVSRIALGTMTFGDADTPPWNIIGGLDLAAADQLVGLAIDHGVNLIDTADAYGIGEAESILGQVLKGRHDDVVLATKVAVRMGPGPNEVAAAGEGWPRQNPVVGCVYT